MLSHSSQYANFHEFKNNLSSTELMFRKIMIQAILQWCMSAMSPQGRTRSMLNRRGLSLSLSLSLAAYCFVVYCKPIQCEILALFSQTWVMETTAL